MTITVSVAAGSWLRLGSGFVKGLGGLGEGVSDGLVPVHVRAASAELPGALIAQGCGCGRADRLGKPCRRGHVGVGGALDDRGSSRPGVGERARDQVQDAAHPAAVTVSLQGADGTAAKLEHGGPVADLQRDPGLPDEVEGVLVAECRA